MEKKEITERLFELEKQVDALKEQVQPSAPPTKWQRFASGTGRLSKWLAGHWFLITFLIGISTAVYVRYVYDIAYLEDYRNTATTKKLSEFYRQLGDSLLYRIQLEEAATAYESALALQKNNERAAQGLAKATVSLPPKGAKYVSPEVVDAKLHHLMEVFPNDPVLLVIKSYREYERNDADEAIRLANEAIKAKPDFAAGYTQLGFYYQVGGIQQAMAYYAKAAELDPNLSVTQNNLGFCRILTGDFKGAISLLEQAHGKTPRLLSALLLGDAYRYDQQIDQAIRTHEDARYAVEGANQETLFAIEYLQNIWVLNYMPYKKGDLQTTNLGVKIYDVNDMIALLNYSLSLDYALRGDFGAADQAFARAAKNKAQQYALRDYVISHINYIENNMNPPAPTMDWLARKREELQ